MLNKLNKIIRAFKIWIFSFRFVKPIVSSKLLFALIGFLVLSACASENASQIEAEVAIITASFPQYRSIEHLASNATEIVRVEVIDERFEFINIWLPPENELEETGGDLNEVYHLFAVNRVKILEVFQGNESVGDILEVKQLGGETEDLIMISYDKVPFVVGDDIIMFLSSFGKDAMPASLLNPEQSAYRFTQSNENARINGINDILESLNPNNDLILTLDDLRQIILD